MKKRLSPVRPSECDVVVAGGGPAGAASAIPLAKAGFRVVVVDRQAFPRDKVCGDFVSPVAVGQLRALGITRKRAFSCANQVRDAAIFVDGTHLLTSAIPTTAALPPSRVIARQTLDHWLIEKAQSVGAEIWQNCRVTSFTTRPHEVRVAVRDDQGEHEIGAQVLIGADGSSSTIARLLRGHSPADDDRIIAVRGYFENVAGPADRVDLYFARETFPGYCWLFPVSESGANVGVGILRNTLPPTPDHLRSLLSRLMRADEALRERLAGARPTGNVVGGVLTTYNGDEPVVGDRTILVGDAAGLINPLNGEGIQYALLSGMWAAEAVLEGAAEGDWSEAALRRYAERLSTELGHDFSVARALVQLIRNRSLNPLWLEALRTIVGRAAVDAEYARLTGGVLAGVVPARQLMNLGVVRKTVEQAAVRVGNHAARAVVSPNALAELGVNASQVAVDLASMILRDRAASERWASNLAVRGRELVTRNYQSNGGSSS